ncbi:inositol monophosphatase family protein [Demequina sp. SO4-18]|uniref:inositol monophosphatase family protein n=1 Tax=Demequina sp. SO4-18 TaxID=3401026 RepID=UPI003B5C2940
MNSDAVGQAMRDVADDLIRPRFRTLVDGEIDTKSGPEDLVTVADVEAEQALTPLLAAIEKQPVVGEEATAADSSLPDLLATEPAAWTVDPVDGTWNFAHGSIDYAVMVGHVVDGDAHSGWILQPETGYLFHGGVDDSVTVTGDDGLVRHIDSVAGHAARPLSELRGMAVLRFAPESAAAGLVGLAEDVAEVTPPRMCAGWDYWDVIDGELDFLLYFRAMPWDHAPGAAICRAAGYAVRHLDGAEYRPGAPGRPFLVARESEWEALADAIRARATL